MERESGQFTKANGCIETDRDFHLSVFYYKKIGGITHENHTEV